MSQANVDLVRRLQAGPHVDLAAMFRSEDAFRELIDAGERVVVLVRDYGRRKESRQEVELVAGAVWTVRDGKMARADFYRDRPSALKAVGLAG
jgi:ketosteroid isomerase-like protein